MKKLLLSGISLLIASGLVGCSGYPPITMHHTQQTGVAVIAGASNVNVSVAISYERTEPTGGELGRGQLLVGKGTDLVGHSWPTFVLSEPIDVTINNALQEELSARGYRVSEAAPIRITITVGDFYNQFRFGLIAPDAIATLHMDVGVLSANGDKVYLREIAAKGRKTFIDLGTRNELSENAGIALNRAIDSGLKTLFNDHAFISALTH